MDRVQAFMATQARAELSTIADGLGMPVYAVRRALKRLAEEGFVRMAQRRQGSHGGSVYERTGA
jgi:predicted ArsR family transcriptional regulator